MIKKYKWTFCLILFFLFEGKIFADDQLKRCEKDYQFCISYLTIMNTSTLFASSPNELVNYLEKKLTNSDLLSIKIIGKPRIKIYKYSGEYYVHIENSNNSYDELLWNICAKISTECYEKNN